MRIYNQASLAELYPSVIITFPNANVLLIESFPMKSKEKSSRLEWHLHVHSTCIPFYDNFDNMTFEINHRLHLMICFL